MPPAVEVLACWPTAVPLPADWGGAEVEVGVPPARTELAARWRPGGRPTAEGAPHPAVVALFDALHEHGCDARVDSVRQSVLPDGDGEDGTVEVAVTIA